MLIFSLGGCAAVPDSDVHGAASRQLSLSSDELFALALEMTENDTGLAFNQEPIAEMELDDLHARTYISLDGIKLVTVNVIDGIKTTSFVEDAEEAPITMKR